MISLECVLFRRKWSFNIFHFTITSLDDNDPSISCIIIVSFKLCCISFQFELLIFYAVIFISILQTCSLCIFQNPPQFYSSSRLLFINSFLVNICWNIRTEVLSTLWASYQIHKIAGCAHAGNVGNISTPPRVSDLDMHHGTCVHERAVMHAGIAN